MNKSQLINAVAEKSGLKKKDADAAVNAFFEALEQALAEGEKVQLFGFGNFSVEERSERKGRNPATGESITIPATKQVKFAPASTLKAKING